jgi:hypothetical protein
MLYLQEERKFATGAMKILKNPLSISLTSVVLLLSLVTGCSTPVETKSETISKTPSQDCTPGYSPCLPELSDYDCKGGQGNGPGYTGPVRVFGVDKYELDRDGNGYAC